MTSDRLFQAGLTTPAMAAAMSDEAWVRRLLDVEAAIAQAEARRGVIPAAAGAAIAETCAGLDVDVEALGRASERAGNPAIPLVELLTAAVPPPADRHVHWGVTSQDVIDTAMMLLARDGLRLLVADLDRVAAACATLAERHRDTLMAGRTLLQQALPITFGLKAAGWLDSTLDARARLLELASSGLAVQFGGAAGTLAALGDRGLEVARELALDLGLAEPAIPWHAARGRVAGLAAGLAVAAGTMAKVARDVGLLAQTEVGEVSERSSPGRGGSSTLPHKHNPVGAVAVLVCASGATARAAVLLGGMGHEHERAFGDWQAEWPAVTDAFRLAGGAVGRAAELLEGLDVHPERMRANLDAGGGLILSERVMMALADQVGRAEAKRVVAGAAEAAAVAGGFEAALLADPVVATRFGPAGVRELLDPAGYLGATATLIGRVLDRHRAGLAAPGRGRGPKAP